jgi:hypothetical protein
MKQMFIYNIYCCWLEVSSPDFNIPNFFIDNAHLKMFITPFDVYITRIHQLAVELGSTDRGRRNSSKARVLPVVRVVILSLMNFFGFE